MAGGMGTRLLPLTRVVNKHLLPIYDKPLVFYPLTTLMLAGIREYAIISSPREIENFKQLLRDGSEFGISIKYIEQQFPKGIAEGITLSANFLGGSKFALILGDNLFHGIGLGRQLQKYSMITGAQIFGYRVRDPQNYGVANLDSKGILVDLEEKPAFPKSNIAVPGLYFYDELAVSLAANLLPSNRGELEITDLNRKYLELGLLNIDLLSQGTTWFDSGTFEGIHVASTYVRIVQDRQDVKIGDPKEASRILGWVD
jgi:glucose-1-phosphate thymidylyltransferase